MAFSASSLLGGVDNPLGLRSLINDQPRPLLEVLTPAPTADLDQLAALRTFLFFPSRPCDVQRRPLSHNRAQSVEFLAASPAKLAENIERISVGSDKLAELGKTLVGFNISIENFS